MSTRTLLSHCPDNRKEKREAWRYQVCKYMQVHIGLRLRVSAGNVRAVLPEKRVGSSGWLYLGPTALRQQSAYVLKHQRRLDDH